MGWRFLISEVPHVRMNQEGFDDAEYSKKSTLERQVDGTKEHHAHWDLPPFLKAIVVEISGRKRDL